MSEWGIKKAVIGVSGGIDSAVAAVLYSRILGPENVYLVNMPSQFNSQLTRRAAEELAHNLGCPFAEVGIDESTNHTRVQLESIQFSGNHSHLDVSNFVFENIQARDRGGRILAAIAAALGAVIPCNANKAEFTVGYSTLYGDLAGFLCALGDLWKQDVYALAHFYNDEVYGKKIIPQATLDVVPSAELSHNHDVTQNKGDPLIYPYHDSLFRSWVEHWDRKTPLNILTAYKNGTLADLIGCDPKIISDHFSSASVFVNDLEKWWRLYQGLGVVKRIQAPPIVGISKRAYGFDHRESLGAVHFGKSYKILKQAILEKEREQL